MHFSLSACLGVRLAVFILSSASARVCVSVCSVTHFIWPALMITTDWGSGGCVLLQRQRDPVSLTYKVPAQCVRLCLSLCMHPYSICALRLTLQSVS